MTPEELKAQEDALLTKIKGQNESQISEFKDEFKGLMSDAKSGAITTEAFDAKFKSISDSIETSAADLKKSLADNEEKLRIQGIEMKKLQDGGSNEKLNWGGLVEKALKSKHDELKNWVSAKKEGGWFEIQVKAVDSITSTNVTSDPTPDNYAASMATSFSPYIREEIFVESYLDTGNTDKPSLAYVNESAGEGDAAIVAEGGLKPLIDADYVTRFSEAKKVAGRMKASEESLSDFGWLQSAIQTTLKRKHDIARQNKLLNGTGGTDLNGIVSLATPFNAAMLADIKGAVQDVQKYDMIASIAAAIEVQSEGTFVPNVAFVNTLDALQMKLIKDANNNYLLPPFITKDGKVIDGISVVAKPTITSDSFIIGDLKNVKLRDVWGYTVRIGRSGDDFAENMVTMLGESRLHLYISDNDKRGIIAGTFTDVKTALEA